MTGSPIPQEQPSPESIGISTAPLLAPTNQLNLDLPESGIRLEYPGRLSVRRILGKLQPRSQNILKEFCAGSKQAKLENLLIEGDNLQVMASLYRYRGQVDLIIADPPYNTGNDFRYNDRWNDDPNDPDPGQLVTSDDGARHTKWMRFMAPRLEMMKAMLRPGGVCAVCIDERELFRLGMLMDDTFGESNRLAIINWQKSYSAKNDSAHVSTATEYVLVYARVRDKAKTGLLERTEAMNARYRSIDGDPHVWRSGDLGAKPHPKPEDYGIQSPFTGMIHYPAGNGRWRRKKSEIKKALEAYGSQYVEIADPNATLPSLVLKGTVLLNNELDTAPKIVAEAAKRAHHFRETEIWPEVIFLDGGLGRPSLKRYLKDVKQGKVPLTFWADEEYEEPLTLGSQSWVHAESGHSQAGITELAEIIGPKHGFETVKPLKLITKIIQLWCPSNGLVLDPFAGSGTTGHAILKMNHDTGSSRKFILIEQSRPERGDPYARTLTAERLKRVISGKWDKSQQAPLAGGFTFKTSSTQIDHDAVLAMQREEMVDLILMSHWDSKTRKGPMLETLTHKGFKYLVAKDISDNGYFLVWDGPHAKTPLSVEIMTEIIKEAADEGLKQPYHVYARTSHLMAKNIIFYQIPDEILRRIGFHEDISDEVQE